MRLSTRSRYGIRLMMALAMEESSEPVFLKQIATSEGISEKYLSQIIIPLKNSGLVITYRGAHGGYKLSRKPSEINIREIVEPLEGDLSLVECVAVPGSCGKSSECVSRSLWDEMSRMIIDYLSGITLADLIERCRKISQVGDAVNYVI